DYLSSLTPGEYEYNFVTNYGSVEFTITVIFGVNEPSIIEISSNHFSIKSPQDIVLELAFYDGEFDALEMNDTVVNQSNYQINDHELVIKSSFLSTLVVGTKTFTVISTTGEVTFEVVVMDN